MLHKRQRLAAAAIGIVVGLILSLGLIYLNRPKPLDADTGASVGLTARSGFSIEVFPARPESIIKTTNFKAGEERVGLVNLQSFRSEPSSVHFELDKTSISIADTPLADSLQISFGENGSLGQTTLAGLEDGSSEFTLQKLDKVSIPITLSFPAELGSSVAGQSIDFTINPVVDIPDNNKSEVKTKK